MECARTAAPSMSDGVCSHDVSDIAYAIVFCVLKSLMSVEDDMSFLTVLVETVFAEFVVLLFVPWFMKKLVAITKYTVDMPKRNTMMRVLRNRRDVFDFLE